MRLRVEVTIPNSGECGQSEIATGDELFRPFHLIDFEGTIPRLLFFFDEARENFSLSA